MTDKTLSIPGISCGHCKKTIENALSALPGVDKVEVAVDRKTVALRYDGSSATYQAVIANLDDQGFEVAS